jgi:hypothetical protein
MIEYFQNDVRRINHALKVFSFAQIISEKLDLDTQTKELIYYSALLHDIGIKEALKKYKSSAGKYQEIEGPKIAEKILSDLNIPVETIYRVCFITGNHHSYNKIDGIDFQILVEADFLVNMYEDDMDINSIKKIYKGIFKTEEGNKLLETMYLNPE